MDNRRASLIVALTLGVAFLTGVFFLGLLLARRAGTVEVGAAAASAPVLPFIILVVIALLAVVMGVTVYMQRQNRGEEKAKRDLDMYSVIDDLVHDLTPAEVAFLRRHLDAAEGDGALIEQSMESLLDQRASDRRAGRR